MNFIQDRSDFQSQKVQTLLVPKVMSGVIFGQLGPSKDLVLCVAIFHMRNIRLLPGAARNLTLRVQV